MIGILSKHLPKTVFHLGSPPGDCILELIFLVESARYHLHNFQKLIQGNGEAPTDFQSGTDIKGEMLNHIWCQMVSITEFEAFLTTSKRCLDRGWWCLAGRFGEKTKSADTLYRATTRLSDFIKDKNICKLIESLDYYSILKDAWEEWGAELANLRHFIEHHAPLGGRISHPISHKIEDGVSNIDFYIPDHIPIAGKKVKKSELKYFYKRSAVEYANSVMLKLDSLVSKLLDEVKNIRDINPAEHLIDILDKERVWGDLSDENYNELKNEILNLYGK